MSKKKKMKKSEQVHTVVLNISTPMIQYNMYY